MTTEQEVAEAFSEQLDAMVAGDVERLSALLGESFTLTHITGYVQPKTEWMNEIAEGKFRYHSATVDRITVDATDPGRANLAGRIITDASVYGGRSYWRLNLTQSYRRVGDNWVAELSVATTW